MAGDIWGRKRFRQMSVVDTVPIDQGAIYCIDDRSGFGPLPRFVGYSATATQAASVAFIITRPGYALTLPRDFDEGVIIIETVPEREAAWIAWLDEARPRDERPLMTVFGRPEAKAEARI